MAGDDAISGIVNAMVGKSSGNVNSESKSYNFTKYTEDEQLRKLLEQNGNNVWSAGAAYLTSTNDSPFS